MVPGHPPTHRQMQRKEVSIATLHLEKLRSCLVTTRVQEDSGGAGRGWTEGVPEGRKPQRPFHVEGRGEDSRKASISFPLTRTVSFIVTEQPY